MFCTVRSMALPLLSAVAEALLATAAACRALSATCWIDWVMDSTDASVWVTSSA